MSSEFAIVMTAFLTGFVLLVVFAGRVANAENDVRSAAHEAARSASLTASPMQAISEAERVVRANLTTSGLSCASGLDVNVEVAEFRPGGWVSVTVACTAPLSDLATLAVPGRRTFTSTATEVIDAYRSDP